jgi:RNA polymerase sigma-70 factor, ECF subfamily
LLDQRIIEECKKGNLQDFRKVVEYSTPLAFSVALRMLCDEDSAMDAVQETMITVWKKIGTIDSPQSYKTWMYRIVMNKCYDELRKRKRSPELSGDETMWKSLGERISENPGKQADNRELASIITVLTAKLSPRQKAVFVMADLEDMTGEEISQITGMNRMNVKSTLHYARKRIGELINKYM